MAVTRVLSHTPEGVYLCINRTPSAHVLIANDKVNTILKAPFFHPGSVVYHDAYGCLEVQGYIDELSEYVFKILARKNYRGPDIFTLKVASFKVFDLPRTFENQKKAGMLALECFRFAGADNAEDTASFDTVDMSKYHATEILAFRFGPEPERVHLLDNIPYAAAPKLLQSSKWDESLTAPTFKRTQGGYDAVVPHERKEGGVKEVKEVKEVK